VIGEILRPRRVLDDHLPLPTIGLIAPDTRISFPCRRSGRR
jgi:hypothetical protein